MGGDEELKSYLFRFGAVLICGSAERSIEIEVLERLTVRAQTRVLAFVVPHFRRGQNFDRPTIAQLLLRFDPESYRIFVDFEGKNGDVKEGIASCYAFRNSAARAGTIGVGAAHLNELLIASRQVLDAAVVATA